VLEAAYWTHIVYQRPLVQSPPVITADTFDDHLGQKNGYVAFFAPEGAATLEDYIFSPADNLDLARDAGESLA